MLIQFCKSKIAHAVVTEAELLYEGSVTIDAQLMKAVGIISGERVEVLNINNGNRFDTYAIAGKAGSGVICLNGPAARLGVVGDRVIILSYAYMSPEEAKTAELQIIHVDAHNRIKK